MNLVLIALLSSFAADAKDVILVVGASGTPEYATMFSEWASTIEEGTPDTAANLTRIGAGAVDSDDGVSDRQRLQQQIAELAQRESSQPVWLILIGHGTHNSRSTKFNLRGPDVSATELSKWLEPVSRPVVVVNCTSCSGLFIKKLSSPNRVVVTATRSGHELNFARFGKFFSQALVDKKVDLDKDEQTSVLEAFLVASRQVRDFYDSEGRLATEHALIDDNGDGLGTPAEWFYGIRPTKAAKTGSLDGLRANQSPLIPSVAEQKMTPAQQQERNQLEAEIESLRQQKTTMPADDYYRQLEEKLLGLAQLYKELE